MARKKVVKRNYPFADSHLIMTANMIISFVLRDITEFAAYAVTVVIVTTYTNKVNAFEEYPTDIELKGAQRVKTEAKDAMRETILGSGRGVLARVSTVYAEGSAMYDSFGLKGMNGMSDSELLVSVRRAARVANDNLAALAGTGIDAAFITALLAECQAFEDAIKEQKDAIAARDMATEERIEMGNAIYENMMDWCGYGQAIWAETSEAKFNDYVIYNSSGGLVNPIIMNIAAGATEMIINKVYTAADVFEIANTGAANLKFAFCPDEVTPTGGGIGLAPGETKTVTASELGDFATNHYLNCTNGDAVEGSFKIKLP
jgi:hypothetical protein